MKNHIKVLSTYLRVVNHLEPASPDNICIKDHEDRLHFTKGEVIDGLTILEVYSKTLLYKCHCGRLSEVNKSTFRYKGGKCYGCANTRRTNKDHLVGCKNYIGVSNDVEYKTWMYLLINNKIGKEWKDYKLFKEYLINNKKEGSRMYLLDRTKPYSPDNVKFIDAFDFKNGSIYKEFKIHKIYVKNGKKYADYECIKCGDKTNGGYFNHLKYKKVCLCKKMNSTDHPYYSIYANIQHGKEICEEWKDFDTFVKFLDGNLQGNGKPKMRKIRRGEMYSPTNVVIWKNYEEK